MNNSILSKKRKRFQADGTLLIGCPTRQEIAVDYCYLCHRPIDAAAAYLSLPSNIVPWPICRYCLARGPEGAARETIHQRKLQIEFTELWLDKFVPMLEQIFPEDWQQAADDYAAEVGPLPIDILKYYRNGCEWPNKRINSENHDLHNKREGEDE
jgi:hypothetical protein